MDEILPGNRNRETGRHRFSRNLIRQVGKSRTEAKHLSGQSDSQNESPTVVKMCRQPGASGDEHMDQACGATFNNEQRPRGKGTRTSGSREQLQNLAAQVSGEPLRTHTLSLQTVVRV